MAEHDPSRFPVIDIQHRADLAPLTEEEVHFEIDLCIGCDRCLSACPLPLASMITIADLNLATISDTISPQIARFTQECVMCGSCVPVCPVNNHRDLLMFWLKQRLGVPWDGTVDLRRIFHSLPAGWNLDVLLSRIREIPLFMDPQQVPDTYLLHFIASSKILLLNPDAVVLQEGAYERDIYCILEGRFSLSFTGPTGEAVAVAILHRREFFGEYGLLTGQPSAMTACAQTASVVLKVPEQTMQRMMELVPTVRSFFEGFHQNRSAEFIMKRLALFQGMAAADFHQLACQVQFERYDRGEPIFTESETGQLSESLCIIVEGFVKVTCRTLPGRGRQKGDQRIIAYRQAGDYFVGGLDLLGDGRAVTVTAISRTRVAVLPRRAVQAMLACYPAVRQRFMNRLQQYRAAADTAQTFIGMMALPRSSPTRAFSDPKARAGLRALVGDGVVEGTDVLIIDLDRCVQCNECEEACARRHGQSRMNRKGMVVGNISIATACRHCQDPVCLLCSRAGIARMPSGEVYITENCIGCGICAERCPYDNISIVSLSEEAEEHSLWQRFRHFFTKGAGKERGKRILPVVNKGAAQGVSNAPSPRMPWEKSARNWLLSVTFVQATRTRRAFRPVLLGQPSERTLLSFLVRQRIYCHSEHTKQQSVSKDTSPDREALQAEQV